MKKFFYLFALVLVSFNLSAQIPAVTNDSTLKALTLDFIHGTGVKPWGWWVNGSTGKPRATLLYEHVKDRFEGEEPRAAKFIAEMNGEVCTWHINAALSSGSSSWVEYRDYSPIEIPLETDFYFTFWAKAEVDGSTFHLGTIEVWNTGFFKGDNVGWDKMPMITCTENWTKYAVKVSEEQTLEENWINSGTPILDEFRIHFRSDITLYIDDIEIFLGDELPEDIGHYFVAGVEYDKDGKPVGGTGVENTQAAQFKIYPTAGGLLIDSEGGALEIYNINGQKVMQDNIEAGYKNIQLANSSVYILKLTNKEGKESTKKVVL